MIAVDTNVLVYAVDADQPDRLLRAQQLLGELATSNDMPVLLWQVAAEFLACLRRRERERRITRSDIETYLDRFVFPLRVVFPTVRSLGLALELSSSHSLSHWDSMLLAACIEAGVTTLYSEDLAAGTTYRSVTVINPFKD
jgi:predicted nucleic acid-binding protein